MYDFKREVEPVLEVLVGKALEAARYELIEELDASNHQKEHRQFKQVKESMLMQTQRLEA